jgi:hypothetical protein
MKNMKTRKDKRFAELHRCLVKDRWAQKNPAYRGTNAQTFDLSVSGARICSEQEFPAGYVVRVAIDLEKAGTPLEVDGEVVWTRKSEDGQGCEMGVEFLHNIPTTVVSLIKHFYGKKVGVPSLVH